MLIWWGASACTQFYNDGCISLLGPEHPRALGHSGQRCWNKVWAVIAPMLENVYNTGQATCSEDLRLILDRHVPREECYFTLSCSPIRDDDGSIGGVFCTCSETTARVLGERRLRTLCSLNKVAAKSHTATSACEVATWILGGNPGDIPFALIYLVAIDGEQTNLTAAFGLERGSLAAAHCISLRASDPATLWPLREVLLTGTARQVAIPETASGFVPGGLWPEAARAAFIVPLAAPNRTLPTGFLVCGLSPRRVFDDDYRCFLELAGGHIGTSISNTRAYDDERRHARRLAAAEESEARVREELIVELAAMNRLYEISTRWLEITELEPLLQDVLDASMALLNANLGKIQLYDSETGELRVVTQRGFNHQFVQRFDALCESAARLACRTAFQLRSRVVIQNVVEELSCASHRFNPAGAAYRSLQSTPLISRGGEMLGALSTYFLFPHQPKDRDLRLLDLYARQATELIERQRADEQLRRSEERFRRYFDLGLIGGALTSPDKRWLEVNDELCRILGYERDELLRTTWAEITHPDDTAADLVQFERVIVGEIDGYSLDKRWIRKGGAIVYSIMAARAVRRSDGTIDYIVKLVQNITARKLAEESLQLLQAELAHVERVSTMGEMASSIAHEVNQPLTAIIANANACARWLARKPKNLLEANAAVTRIVRDATRASEIIARIRAFVQRREMQRSPLDLVELTRETVSMAEAELRAQDIAFNIVVLAPQLPPVIGDRVHIQQVLLNLLKNGVEAMQLVSNRKRVLEIRVDAYSPESLRVAVSDSGIGLDPRQREQVFDAFHTTKPGGMGMGLAISRSIVEAHAGQLWLTDNDGPGMTFQFTLPTASQIEIALPRPKLA
jgi:PAS domain S-box-containing protein